MRAAALCLAAGLCALGAAASPGGDARPEPFEVVRSLRMLQDRITRGDAEAVAAQKAQLAEIGEALDQTGDEAWKAPRNLRAALAFVLSGGDAAVLRKLLARGVVQVADEKLVRGVLAYATNRNAEALEALAAINARTLDPALGGQIALAQAELAAKTDPAKALTHLDEARLLAPGTLIEEGALRRQVSLLTGLGEFERADVLTEQYLRRFGRSAYASAFKRQLARFAALRPGLIDPPHMAGFEAALQWLDAGDRQDIFLSVAQESLGKGRVDLAHYAVDRALALAGDSDGVVKQAHVYRAAALAATAEFDSARTALETLQSVQLNPDDAELIAAAVSVMTEVRRLPESPTGSVQPAVLDELTGAFAQVKAGREAMAEVDRMLEMAK